MKTLLTLFAVCFVLQQSAAQPPTPPKWEPQTGDRVVFLGDSITHQCLYTQFLENWIALSYPDRVVQFRNAGVGGDRTVNMPARFDEDVAAFEPTHVILLLGMNDGGYVPFRQERFDGYREGIAQIIDQVHLIGAELILLSPTFFDAKMASRSEDMTKETLEHYPGVLRLYGTWLAGVAERRGLLYADLYTPMAEMTRKRRRENPTFTLVSDGVHPNFLGHRVIAKTIAQSIIADPGPAAKLTVSTETVHDTAGGTISDFSASVETVTFTHLAKSLPTPDRHETLRVSGLPTDTRWELRIDDIRVGIWPSEALADTVTITAHHRPQYRQALGVVTKNAQRTWKQKDLRAWWEQKKIRDWNVYEWGLLNPDATTDEVATYRAPHDEWLKDFWKMEDTLCDMSTNAWEDIMKFAQPKTHRYELRQVE